jgi:hypothetical protein
MFSNPELINRIFHKYMFLQFCNPCLPSVLTFFLICIVGGATLSTTNPTWPDPGSNPGRRGGKPATNHLSYGAADCVDLLHIQPITIIIIIFTIIIIILLLNTIIVFLDIFIQNAQCFRDRILSLSSCGTYSVGLNW